MKKLTFICAIFIALTFQIMIFGALISYIGYLDGDIEKASLPALLSVFLGIGSILLVSIGALNQYYDNASNEIRNKRGVSRWMMNTIFIALILSLILISIWFWVNNPHTNNILVSSLVVIIIAIMLYLKNYSQKKTRTKRIQEVLRRNNFTGNRRYHYLVEEVKENGMLFGQVTGVIKSGDVVRVMNAGEEVVIGKVTGIQKDGKKVAQAKNEKVNIRLSTKPSDKYVPQKYAVVSGIGPIAERENIINAENPRLLATIENYSQHLEENEYVSCLIYDACHANYLVPARLVEGEKITGDILDIFTDAKNVSFMSVTATEHEDEPIFPVFTDWNALKEYSAVMQEEKMVSMVMTFPQCLNLARARYEGIVINPFGPTPYYFSNEYLRHITELEGYKEDFIYKTQED